MEMDYWFLYNQNTGLKRVNNTNKLQIHLNFNFSHSNLHLKCTRRLVHLLFLHPSSFRNLLWCMHKCRVIHFEFRNMIHEDTFWNNCRTWVPESLRVLASQYSTWLRLVHFHSSPTHDQEEKESQVLRSDNFSTQMIDKSHVQHVTWGCWDMEEYFLLPIFLVC